MDQVHSVAELIEKTQDMPLERMRFFINEDRREPRCFGICQDPGSGFWVVYKNKSDGSRAVRYNGPDEAYAAQELWAKINSEIDLRRAKQPRKKPLTRAQKARRAILTALIAALLATGLFFLVRAIIREPSRGYYVTNDTVYYYQNDYWYWYDGDSWLYYDAPDGSDWYRDGYRGKTYPELEASGDAFEQSPYYVEPSDSNSDVFDSWDVGDTNWDSDW